MRHECDKKQGLMLWTCLPPSARFLALLALASGWLVASRPAPHVEADTLVFWTFGRSHMQQYEPLVARWNADRTPPMEVRLFSLPALTRRVMSGFLSGTPTAPLIEMERNSAAPAFLGPIERVGWTNLTPQIVAEGLDQEMVPNAFTPWTYQGQIFGLPHDVHPVLLAYRADLVEGAGIDLTAVETWDDYFAALHPLRKDGNDDGQPDHFPLSLRLSDAGALEALMLQAGGGLFDQEGRPMLASPTNAQVLAAVVTWTSGPEPVTMEAPEFSASGNAMRLEGRVIGSLMPDWLAGVWKTDLPGLAGKVKLMPLPAWERGGRRTTVTGGTMLGIPKTAPNFEAAWQAAKAIYLAEETAVELFQRTSIITPVRRYWTLPVFDQPDPFFSDQASGRLYIEQALDTPVRFASPYLTLARVGVSEAAFALRRHARATDVWEREALETEALRLLAEAEARLLVVMRRNRFLPASALTPAP